MVRGGKCFFSGVQTSAESDPGMGQTSLGVRKEEREDIRQNTNNWRERQQFKDIAAHCIVMFISILKILNLLQLKGWEIHSLYVSSPCGGQNESCKLLTYHCSSYT